MSVVTGHICSHARNHVRISEVVAKNGFAGKIHVVRTTHDELQLPEKARICHNCCASRSGVDVVSLIWGVAVGCGNHSRRGAGIIGGIMLR